MGAKPQMMGRVHPAFIQALDYLAKERGMYSRMEVLLPAALKGDPELLAVAKRYYKDGQTRSHTD